MTPAQSIPSGFQQQHAQQPSGSIAGGFQQGQQQGVYGSQGQYTSYGQYGQQASMAQRAPSGAAKQVSLCTARSKLQGMVQHVSGAPSQGCAARLLRALSR